MTSFACREDLLLDSENFLCLFQTFLLLFDLFTTIFLLLLGSHLKLGQWMDDPVER